MCRCVVGRAMRIGGPKGGADDGRIRPGIPAHNAWDSGKEKKKVPKEKEKAKSLSSLLYVELLARKLRFLAV